MYALRESVDVGDSVAPMADVYDMSLVVKLGDFSG